MNKNLKLLHLYLNIYQFIIITLNFKKIFLKYPKNITNPYLLYSLSNLSYENENDEYKVKGKNYAFPAKIRYNQKGELFVSVPRHIYEYDIAKTIPGTINILKKGILYPWPNEKENDYSKGKFQSIVGFEIDLNGTVWLLDHKKNKRTLYVYTKDGEYLKEYDLTIPTTHSQHMSYLSNIVLDLNNQYAYISDSGKINLTSANIKDEKIKTKSNIIILNLAKNFDNIGIKILQKDKSTMPEINYTNDINNITFSPKNIGLYGLALSCDKNTLYYSPVKSKNLYSIPTIKLRNDVAILNENDIKKINKKVSSLELSTSARGLFYYTALDDNSVYVNFYEKEYKFNTIRKSGHILNDKNIKKYIDEYPTSLTFNGITGNLTYLVNKHNIFINKNISDKINFNKSNFLIYTLYANDRSYLYPCNHLYYMPNHFWVIILLIALLCAYFIIWFIKIIGKIDYFNKIDVEEHSEELVTIEN